MQRIGYIIMENKEFMSHAKDWLYNHGEQRVYVSSEGLVI